MTSPHSRNRIDSVLLPLHSPPKLLSEIQLAVKYNAPVYFSIAGQVTLPSLKVLMRGAGTTMVMTTANNSSIIFSFV
jgi:hypothetical protein